MSYFPDSGGGVANFFGDASDGDNTLGAPLVLARDMFFGTLDTNGFDVDCAGFRLFCQDDLFVRAGDVVSANGANAIAAAGGIARAAGTIVDTQAGGAGATGAGAAGTAALNSIGNIGGDGGAGSTGAAGAAGTLFPLAVSNKPPRASPEALQLSVGTTSEDGGTGGGGGGGDGASSGGGGGAGGGTIMISARRVTVEATGIIEASGGAGADGLAVDTGGGGGGGGGAVSLVFAELTNLGTVQALGGAAGASGGGAGNPGVVGTVGSVFQLNTSL